MLKVTIEFIDDEAKSYSNHSIGLKELKKVYHLPLYLENSFLGGEVLTAEFCHPKYGEMFLVDSKKRKDKAMCFGGSPKTPTISPAPTPSPTPSVIPAESSPMASGEARRKRLEQLRSGIASTINTGPRGITGKGAELKPPSLTGKEFIGMICLDEECLSPNAVPIEATLNTGDKVKGTDCPDCKYITLENPVAGAVIIGYERYFPTVR